MVKKYCTILFALVILFFMGNSRAEEGMWLLNQLNDLPWKHMQEMGLKLSPGQVQRLKEAVVIIDGGTGEFVSPNGLVLTNHHVAYQALQRASTTEHNYLENGFLAQSPENEIPIPGYEVRITVRFDDVTKKVLSVVKEEMTPLQRYQAIEKRKKALEDEAEAKNKNIEASVVDMFNGMKYYLFLYKRYKDVRLVYAPPRSIGEYGGDIDNWMWPRHTGDFSFFRVYADDKGNPTEYSDKNVPLKTPVYFPISTAGVKEGDFTFIMGYPGRTYRYRSSYSLSYHQHVIYPFRIDMYKTAIEILENEAKRDPDAAIKVSSQIKSLNNALKNNEGMLSGFRKLKLLEKKKKFEEEFLAYLNTHPKMKEKYGDVLPGIANLYRELNKYGRKQQALISILFPDLPSALYSAYRFAIEKEKSESERDPQYSEKNMKRIIERLKVQNASYIHSADRALLTAFLKKALNLPEASRISFVDRIVSRKSGADAEAAIEAYVDEIFRKSQFKDLNSVLPLFEKSKKELDKIDDPLLRFARDIAEEMLPLETHFKEFSGAITQLRPRYIRGIFEWKGNQLYPDANRTLRFTYGTVKGYIPRDAVIYLPKTRLAGIVEKNTGEEPFNAPEKLLELAQSQDYGPWVDSELKDVPVNFLHTTDITGGNSGSPVLNGKGELIGVAFDGNYEAMTSDYFFDPEITRTISVDSRFLLFVLDKFDNAQNLINELKLVR